MIDYDENFFGILKARYSTIFLFNRVQRTRTSSNNTFKISYFL